MAESPSAQLARRLFRAGVAAVDPRRALSSALSISDGQLSVRGQVVVADLAPYKRIVVAGAGKAAGAMGLGLLDCLAQQSLHVQEGLLITKQDHGRDCVDALKRANVDLVEAAHPVPDERGAEATARLLAMLERTSDPTTLVFWLTSGGGSALTPLPVEGLTLANVQSTVRWLLASGAPIDQVNAVRKHLCRAHGGRSALAAGKSTVVTLAVSDVIGNSLATIAGGPTTADPTSKAEVLGIVDRFGKADHASLDATRGNWQNLPETPKVLPANILPGIVVCSLSDAVAAVQEQSRSEGIAACTVLTKRIAGEAKEVAKVVAAMAVDWPQPRPFVLVAGGETTVTIPSTALNGVGGRNQELALAAAVEIAGSSLPLAILSGGTDGTDGPTDFAGAVVTPDTLSKSEEVAKALVALEAHDSTTFFMKHSASSLVRTGPTGTNVMDLIIVVHL